MKFCNLYISKIIIARSFKRGQLIKDYLFELHIALCFGTEKNM